MKKTLSTLLAASMILASCTSVFAQNSMEQSLLLVKERVNIPANFTEFETSTNDYNEKATYYFQWSDEKKENHISVQADTQGHILNYYEYSSKWYNDDDRFKIDNNFDITEIERMAETEMKRLVPELFTSENDKLVMTPYSGNLSIRSRSNYSINFQRQYNGIDVKDNTASISFMNTKDGFKLESAYISWDYDTTFIAAENTLDTQAASKIFAEKFPMKLSYRKDYHKKYYLEYVADGAHYIDAQTAQEVVEDNHNDMIAFSSAAKEQMADAGGNVKSALTPAERAEIEDIESFKKSEELLNIIYAIPELGVTKKLIDGASLNVSTYKTENEYHTFIYVSDNSEKPTDRFQLNIEFNAKTGELINFYRYNYSDRDIESDDIKKGQDKAYEFLNRYFADKLAETEKSTEENPSIYFRKVNDIVYTDNYISAIWNTEKGYIQSLNCQWDADISGMPAPDNIVSLAAATDAMFAKHPLKLTYIIADGKFRLVYAPSEYYVTINAFDGKIVDYNGNAITDRPTGIYNDTEGHWISDIAKKLADYGISMEGESLRPDHKITQSEFLRLIYSSVFGYYWNGDEDQIYSRMIYQKVLSDEEINSTAPITRENAIAYLLRAMGIKEVAEIKGIYICDFTDSDTISADKIGYCAIAKGFGIVNGSDGALLPHNDITRAEALAMIYNYLIR